MRPGPQMLWLRSRAMANCWMFLGQSLAFLHIIVRITRAILCPGVVWILCAGLCAAKTGKARTQPVPNCDHPEPIHTSPSTPNHLHQLSQHAGSFKSCCRAVLVPCRRGRYCCISCSSSPADETPLLHFVFK